MSKNTKDDDDYVFDIDTILELTKPKRHDPQEEAYEELLSFADEILERIGIGEPLGDFIGTKGSEVLSDSDMSDFISIIENPFIKYSLFSEEKNEDEQRKLFTNLYTFRTNDNIERKSNDFYKEILLKGAKHKKINLSSDQRAVIKILLDNYVAKKLNELHRSNRRSRHTKRHKKYTYKPGAKSLPTRLRSKSNKFNKSNKSNKSKANKTHKSI